jgi:signal peptidase II
MATPEPLATKNRFHPNLVINFIKKYWPDYIFLFLIGGVIIGLDQWTKAWVRASIPLGGDWLPESLKWLMPYARIRHWYNSGAAFGIFQNGNLFFTILAIIIILLILYYYPHTERQDWWLRVAMAMQFAGATGNLIDRLFFAHVTDYISVGNFAIFNVADASITTGVAVLIIGVWLKDHAEKRAAAAVINDQSNIAEKGNIKSD